MYVLHEALGLSEEKMIAPMDEKRGKLLLAEILNGGNFGQHFTKYGHFTQQGMAKKYFLKIWRNMHFVRYFPAEALCEPIFRTWHFFWRLKHGDNLSESSFLEALFGLEFGHADFANDADFLLCCLLVPQISRIYTVFFIDYFSPTDFTDFHRSSLAHSFFFFSFYFIIKNIFSRYLFEFQ